jgi:hypothetical protein
MVWRVGGPGVSNDRHEGELGSVLGPCAECRGRQQELRLLHALSRDGDEVSWAGEQEYRKFRADMTTVDGVVLYKRRVVVPDLLRRQVLAALHSAHQGVSGMGLRAQDSVWWPGYTRGIQAVREGCMT